MTPALFTHTSSGPRSAAAPRGGAVRLRVAHVELHREAADLLRRRRGGGGVDVGREHGVAAPRQPLPRSRGRSRVRHPLRQPRPARRRAYQVGWPARFTCTLSRHGDRRGERTAALLRGAWGGRAAPVRARASRATRSPGSRRSRRSRRRTGPSSSTTATSASPRWPTASYEIADMARDALALADELELDSFHLLGISMGGAIAQEIALQAPDRVRTLTLAVTFPDSGAYACRLAEVWGARVRQISREQHVDELMLLNHSEEFFENAGHGRVRPHGDAEQPAPAAAGGVRAPARRVRPPRRARPARLAHDADARDRRRARHPRADLEVSASIAELIPGAKLTVLPEGAARPLARARRGVQRRRARLHRARPPLRLRRSDPRRRPTSTSSSNGRRAPELDDLEHARDRPARGRDHPQLLAVAAHLARQRRTASRRRSSP